MSSVAIASPMSTADLLKVPENGVERWLIRGQLREKPMTLRNRFHSRLEARIAYLLGVWLETQPRPRGAVYCGEVGCRLLRNPDTTVGIDVAYVSADGLATESGETTILESIPVLAVEILSPSDRQDEINEKVDGYLAAGVKLVWVVDPHFCTVRVHRLGCEPIFCNMEQELCADPELPGLRIAVATIFED